MSDTAALEDAAFVETVLDLLVPPNGDVPGAGALGCGAEMAAGLRADATLGPVVEAGLQGLRAGWRQAEPDGVAFLRDQLTANGMLVMALLRYAYPAYYARPAVLEAIGEAPRPPFPRGYEVEETDPALLEKLRARTRFQ